MRSLTYVRELKANRDVRFLYVYCPAKYSGESEHLKNLANIALSWWGGSGSNRRPTDYEND
jgi:hypothetical protein